MLMLILLQLASLCVIGAMYMDRRIRRNNELCLEQERDILVMALNSSQRREDFFRRLLVQYGHF